jgi:hypothetical protein
MSVKKIDFPEIYTAPRVIYRKKATLAVAEA